MAKVELRVPAIITPWRRYCGEEHVGRPTLVPPRAVPARVARRSGRTRRIGGGDGTGAPATLPWTGRAPRWGYGPGPSRHLASTGPINLTVPFSVRSRPAARGHGGPLGTGTAARPPAPDPDSNEPSASIRGPSGRRIAPGRVGAVAGRHRLARPQPARGVLRRPEHELPADRPQVEQHPVQRHDHVRPGVASPGPHRERGPGLGAERDLAVQHQAAVRRSGAEQPRRPRLGHVAAAGHLQAVLRRRGGPERRPGAAAAVPTPLVARSGLEPLLRLGGQLRQAERDGPRQKPLGWPTAPCRRLADLLFLPFGEREHRLVPPAGLVRDHGPARRTVPAPLPCHSLARLSRGGLRLNRGAPRRHYRTGRCSRGARRGSTSVTPRSRPRVSTVVRGACAGRSTLPRRRGRGAGAPSGGTRGPPYPE